MDKELLRIRHKSNSDSWGFSYLHKGLYGDREIKCVRGNGDFEEFWKKFEVSGIKARDILIHFRTGTSGTKKTEGIQPILVCGVAILHNGNFPEYFGKKETDTVLWAKENQDPINHLEEIEKYKEFDREVEHKFDKKYIDEVLKTI